MLEYPNDNKNSAFFVCIFFFLHPFDSVFYAFVLDMIIIVYFNLNRFSFSQPNANYNIIVCLFPMYVTSIESVLFFFLFRLHLTLLPCLVILWLKCHNCNSNFNFVSIHKHRTLRVSWIVFFDFIC